MLRRFSFARLGLALLALFCALSSRVLAFDTVVVDAGHGGHDNGGIPGMRWKEKNVTLAVSLKLAQKLRAQGLKVVMTRTTDVFIPLEERAKIANRLGKNVIFVSVHTDAFTREGANGISTWYASPKAKMLAGYIHNRELEALRPKTDRGLKKELFRVLKFSKCPAVLCEIGYLTNMEEGRKLASPGYQDVVAAAIARGIADARKSGKF